MVASALVSWVWGWAAPDMFDSSPDPEARSSPECTRAIDHRLASAATWSGCGIAPANLMILTS